ncbi:MAG: hypothetical protein JNL66_10445 [Alphaproteobacteria bacterium]|nr:hypothetical protein [Alphaproteobacteria bacterium]
MWTGRIAGALGAAALLSAAAIAWAQASVPTGAYQCPGGAARRGAPPSGLGEIHLGGGGYAAPELRGTGQYRVEGGSTVAFATGPLAGRTATLTSERNGRIALRFDSGGRGSGAICPHRSGG